MPPPKVTIGVVGFGAMGAGIAQVAVRSGHQVLAFDSADGAVERGIEAIRSRINQSAARGRLSADEAGAALGRLTLCRSLSEIGPAGVVIEAVVEDLAAKRQMFGELENVVAPSCILASNTSSLSITALAAGLLSPERLVGMHFFNPAPAMALVEVVSGLATAPGVADTVCELARSWGKTPVRVKSAPGFIVNRLMIPHFVEAIRMIEEGVATIEDIDKAIKLGLNYPMGPFELMDLTGIDIAHHVMEYFYKELNKESKWSVPPLMKSMIRAGRLGRKTRGGWYKY